MTKDELAGVKTLLPFLAIKHIDPQPFADVITALEKSWAECDVLKAVLGSWQELAYDRFQEIESLQAKVEELEKRNRIHGRCCCWRCMGMTSDPYLEERCDEAIR